MATIRTPLITALRAAAGDIDRDLTLGIAQHLLAQAADELEHLQRWKTEATAVITAWEQVHQALDAPGQLGQSKAAATLHEIHRLQAELDPQANTRPRPDTTTPSGTA